MNEKKDKNIKKADFIKFFKSYHNSSEIKHIADKIFKQESKMKITQFKPLFEKYL